MKNILNKRLEICSLNPTTGFYRDGFCRTDNKDIGKHTICSKMNKKFMNYTKKKGNNLYSVVKPGNNWCLCEKVWNQAFKDNIAPKVLLKSTNKKTKKYIVNNILKNNNSTKIKKFNNFNKILLQSNHIYKKKYGGKIKYDKMLLIKGVKIKNPDFFIENIYLKLAEILKKKIGKSKSNKIIPTNDGKYNLKSLPIINIILKKLWDYPGSWWSCKLDVDKLQIEIINDIQKKLIFFLN